jgi:general L-amino acid transport system permease protein
LRRCLPLTEAGAIGWMRKNLFSGPFNIALTIFSVLLIVWIVPPLAKFLVIDAVWDGAGRADCTPARPSGNRRLPGLRHR